MITPTTIYLMTRADSICITAFVFIVLSGIATLFAVIGYFTAKANFSEQEEEAFAKASRLSSAILAVSIAVGLLVPSTKELAAIFIIPRIANSESVEKIGTGIVDLATAWLEELKPNHKTDANQTSKTPPNQPL